MAEETDKQFAEEESRCRQFERELAAFLEGDDRPGVPAHARVCPFCRTILDDLEDIRRLSRQLPLEEPLPAVWANIHATLAAEGILHEPVNAWQRWLQDIRFASKPAPIAALASVVMLGWFLLVPPGALKQSEVSGWLSAAGGAPVAAAVVLEDEADLVRAIREIESSYRAQEVFFEPALKATYEQSLESLNRSIRECLATLQQQPTNTLVREYLHRAYTQKAEVLASALEFEAR